MDDPGLKCPVCGSNLVADAVFCPYCGHRLEGADEHTKFDYEAFISYRHSPADRKAALKVQRAIESFPIPKALQKTAGRKKLGKCFRDEDEIPTADSLSGTIRDALKRSRFLIVVCSPQSRESLWVQQEVLLFASFHGREKILVTLAEGEPGESFPELLLTRLEVDPDGNVKQKSTEPIAADLRNPSRLKSRQECLRLVASLVGCGLDDLRQRLRVRRARAISLLASGIAAISVAFGGFAMYQQAQIAENYRQMQIEESEFLANEAEELLGQGDRYQAIQVALAALPESSTSNDRPLVPSAQLALEKSLQVFPSASANRWLPRYSKDRRAPEVVSISETGLVAALLPDRTVEVSEIASGDTVCVINARELVGAASKGQSYMGHVGEALSIASNDLVVSFVDSVVDAEDLMDENPFSRAYEGERLAFAGDRLIYRSDSGHFGCFDAQSGSLIWETDLSSASACDDIVVSRDGSMIAAAKSYDFTNSSTSIYVLDASDGSMMHEIALPNHLALGIDAPQETTQMQFSPDGTHLAVGRWGLVFEIDLSTGEYRQIQLQHDMVLSVDYNRVPSMLFAVSTDGHFPTLTGGENVTLEVFDDSLEKLWERAGEIEYITNQHDLVYPSKVKVCDWWNYYGNDDEQLVVIFSRNLLLLDGKTGEEVFRIPADAPYLDCRVSKTEVGSYICAATADGTLMERKPLNSNKGASGTLFDTTTTASESSVIYALDGREYALMAPAGSQKHVVYRFARPAEMEGAKPFESALNDARFRWGTQCIVGTTGTSVAAWDGNTFEEIARWDFDDLEMLGPVEDESDVLVKYSDDTRKVVVSGANRAGDGSEGDGTAVYVLDVDSGSIAASCTIEDVKWDFDGVLAARALDSKRMAVLVGNYHNVVVFDPEQPDEPIARINRPYPNRIGAALFTGSTLILQEETIGPMLDKLRDGAHSQRMEVIDTDTGAVIQSDLMNYVPIAGGESLGGVASPDCSRLAMVCDDGALRLFDTHTGDMLWETFDTPPFIQNIHIMKDGDVLVQGSDGHLSQLSGTDGSIRRVSSTAMEAIDFFLELDDSTIATRYHTSGVNQHTGLAIIPTDAESLDPISDIYYGNLISRDGSSIVVRDDRVTIAGGKAEMSLFRRYSLDALIDMAHEEIKGHELTNTERYLYQID